MLILMTAHQTHVWMELLAQTKWIITLVRAQQSGWAETVLRSTMHVHSILAKTMPVVHPWRGSVVTTVLVSLALMAPIVKTTLMIVWEWLVNVTMFVLMESTIIPAHVPEVCFHELCMAFKDVWHFYLSNHVHICVYVCTCVCVCALLSHSLVLLLSVSLSHNPYHILLFSLYICCHFLVSLPYSFPVAYVFLFSPPFSLIHSLTPGWA